MVAQVGVTALVNEVLIRTFLAVVRTAAAHDVVSVVHGGETHL